MYHIKVLITAPGKGSEGLDPLYNKILKSILPKCQMVEEPTYFQKVWLGKKGPAKFKYEVKKATVQGIFTSYPSQIDLCKPLSKKFAFDLDITSYVEHAHCCC